MLRLQDKLNFGNKLSSIIFALAKHCLNIYEQIQVIDQIREKIKSLTTV